MGMRTLLFGLSTILLISCGTSQQTVKGYYPEKYTIELPKGWESKPKLVKAITEILPVAMKELKDREFCLNCNAGYTVKIEVSKPNTDQIALRENEKFESIDLNIQLFSFGASFVLYNKEKNPIVLMKIVDPEDAYMLKGQNHTAIGSAPYSLNPRPPLHGINTLDIDYRSYSEKTYSVKEIQRIKNGPDQTDLLIIMEQRILEIQKIIENMALVESD